MLFESFVVESQPVFTIVDISGRVRDWVAGLEDGLCNVYLPHGTAAVAILEINPKIERDIQAAFERTLPRDDALWHNVHQHSGHVTDHLYPLFAGASVTIPVRGGELMLGEWQSVLVIDPNIVKRERTVYLSYVTDGMGSALSAGARSERVALSD